MKYTITINQKKALELGIKKMEEAAILQVISLAPNWAKRDKQDYLWIARQKILQELPILNIKPDTVYRYYKELSKRGFIKYKKSGKKDMIKLTKKGLSLFSDTMSEKNPSYYVGKKSENTMSEKNPTHKASKYINKKHHTSHLKRSYKTPEKKSKANLKGSTMNDDFYIYETEKTNKKTEKDSTLEEKLEILKHFGVKGANLTELAKNNTLNIIKPWIDYIEKSNKTNKTIYKPPGYLVSVLKSGIDIPPKISNPNNTSSLRETEEKIIMATNFLKNTYKDDRHLVPQFKFYLRKNKQTRLLEVFHKDYKGGLPKPKELNITPNAYSIDNEFLLLMKIYDFSKIINKNPNYFDTGMKQDSISIANW